jgi:ADP-ribose pyrophosphatase YjhB (NUDIX family)
LNEMSLEIRPRIRVAAVVVKADRVLLVQHQKGDERYWMLPGGGVDHGETLVTALARELDEELCVAIDVGPMLFMNDSIAPDGTRHIVNIHFAATIRAGEPRLGEDERIVDVAYHPIADLDRLVLRPAFGAALQAQLLGNPPEGGAYWGAIWT